MADHESKPAPKLRLFKSPLTYDEDHPEDEPVDRMISQSSLDTKEGRLRDDQIPQFARVCGRVPLDRILVSLTWP